VTVSRAGDGGAGGYAMADSGGVGGYAIPGSGRDSPTVGVNDAADVGVRPSGPMAAGSELPGRHRSERDDLVSVGDELVDARMPLELTRRFDRTLLEGFADAIGASTVVTGSSVMLDGGEECVIVVVLVAECWNPLGAGAIEYQFDRVVVFVEFLDGLECVDDASEVRWRPGSGQDDDCNWWHALGAIGPRARILFRECIGDERPIPWAKPAGTGGETHA